LRLISDRSLCCFLEDLRSSLDYYKENAQENLVFINIDGFFWYMKTLSPGVAANTHELMETLTPFIPMIITEENLGDLLRAAEDASPSLAQIELDYLNKSKLKFIYTILSADSWEEWDRIRNICRTIRNYKSQLQTNYV